MSGRMFDEYIDDMKIVQKFAELNRQAMADEIVKGMKLHIEEQFTTIHNYIDTDEKILRKGAVSARDGERLLAEMLPQVPGQIDMDGGTAPVPAIANIRR